MNGKIIALVDGSIYSKSVCDHVAWIAGRTGEAVELHHVLGRDPAADLGDYSGSIKLGARSDLLSKLSRLDEERAKLAHAHGRAILDDAAAILANAGVAEVTTRLRHGEIIETVAGPGRQASLIVIGKRGEAADFNTLHLGSNLERIVRVSVQPVFVASRAFRPISKVMIAFDGEASSLKAVDQVARSPLFEGLDCVVVTVGGVREKAEAMLTSATQTLSAGGHRAETVHLEGQPEDTIGRFVEERAIDLLIMGAYGHSRIRTLIIGSTTSEMIRTCKIPILLMK